MSEESDLFRDPPELSGQFDKCKIQDEQMTLNACHNLKHDFEMLRNENNAYLNLKPDFERFKNANNVYYSKEKAIIAEKYANAFNKKANFETTKPLGLIQAILAKVLKLFRGK